MYSMRTSFFSPDPGVPVTFSWCGRSEAVWALNSDLGLQIWPQLALTLADMPACLKVIVTCRCPVLILPYLLVILFKWFTGVFRRGSGSIFKMKCTFLKVEIKCRPLPPFTACVSYLPLPRLWCSEVKTVSHWQKILTFSWGLCGLGIAM